MNYTGKKPNRNLLLTNQQIAINNGKIFENFIYKSIKDSGVFTRVLREKEIRSQISKDITTIDVMGVDEYKKYVVMIQCKYTNGQPELNKVKAFMRDCETLIKIRFKGYHILKYYLTKTDISKTSYEILENENRKYILSGWRECVGYSDVKNEFKVITLKEGEYIGSAGSAGNKMNFLKNNLMENINIYLPDPFTLEQREKSDTERKDNVILLGIGKLLSLFFR